ncbi:hypothetical protein BC628DRAFT_1168770 [Trametes gibbosa]|nr:hypothetical protein BC628DRAFT_1168770 [Trametes gibbosa]
MNMAGNCFRSGGTVASSSPCAAPSVCEGRNEHRTREPNSCAYTTAIQLEPGGSGHARSASVFQFEQLVIFPATRMHATPDMVPATARARTEQNHLPQLRDGRKDGAAHARGQDTPCQAGEAISEGLAVDSVCTQTVHIHRRRAKTAASGTRDVSWDGIGRCDSVRSFARDRRMAATWPGVCLSDKMRKGGSQGSNRLRRGRGGLESRARVCADRSVGLHIPFRVRPEARLQTAARYRLFPPPVSPRSASLCARPPSANIGTQPAAIFSSPLPPSQPGEHSSRMAPEMRSRRDSLPTQWEQSDSRDRFSSHP